MRTILDILGFQVKSYQQSDLIDLLNDEENNCKKLGDFWGAGEWLISKVPFVKKSMTEALFVQVIVLWASQISLRVFPTNMKMLNDCFDEFLEEDLARAFVTATLRFTSLNIDLPTKSNDLSFKLADSIEYIYNIKSNKPINSYKLAANKLNSAHRSLINSVLTFSNTSCLEAKTASIEVIKHAHKLRKYTLPSENNILADIDILLGPVFRKYCEHCEKRESDRVIKRAIDLKEQANRVKSTIGPKTNNILWHLIISKLIQHLVDLSDEGSSRSASAVTPALSLANNVFKINLLRQDREFSLSARLHNRGEGRAVNVKISYDHNKYPVELRIIEPKGEFEVNGNSEQLINLGITLRGELSDHDIPVKWTCEKISKDTHINDDKIMLRQQLSQPNWELISQDPPYTINPIKTKDKLYGRDSNIGQLKLYVKGKTSSFIWGQKRIGKTSLAQVLTNEFIGNKDIICLLFRMGELGAYHEGQIAHLIAQRIYDKLEDINIPNPAKEEYGAGLNRLIPFIESIVNKYAKIKIVIIIDEFDDIDRSFYTGERGKQFIKALRSLSEIGMTFYFIGSERMSAIYEKHQGDLNKWKNIFLDCIESRNDCRDLIIKPVEDIIEYQAECVNDIIDYCNRNPFYMHLLCGEIFARCFQENRTYVSENDVEAIKQYLVQTLGRANFSHFWGDIPEIDEDVKHRNTANNCLVLYCLANLNGLCESIDELCEVQETIGLGPSERMSRSNMDYTVNRLIHRKILSKDRSRIMMNMRLFVDWLRQNGEVNVMPIWKDYRLEDKEEDHIKYIAKGETLSENFIISEEELFSVSSRLTYQGKQKDVAEIRNWLRQFDDDVRIEIAFSFLKRLAEKGFMDNGAKLLALDKLENAIKEKRLTTGKGAWNIVRGKKEDLCIAYIDSEMKSGATTARELAKRLRPGKQGSSAEISTWMKAHSKSDGIVVFVDDFSGTGSTISKGLKLFIDKNMDGNYINHYLREDRILCCVQYAMPEAIEKIKEECPLIQVLVADYFDDSVRALDENAGLFEDEKEKIIAEDMLTQIGRELYRENPLGYGNQALLISFHDTIPNNTIPIFWSHGIVNDKQWNPLFPRA